MATTYLNGVLFTGLGAPDSPVITTTADVADTILSSGTLTGSVFSTSYNDDDIFFAGNATNALFDGGAQNDDLELGGIPGNIPVTFSNITVDGSGGSDYLDFGTGFAGPTKVNIVNSLIRGGGGDSLGGTDAGDYLYFGEDTTITGTKINGNVGNDDIHIFGPTLTTSSVLGGEDNDSICIGSNVVGSLINGNKGNDDIDIYGEVSAASSVYGGQGSDDISVHDTFTASLLSGDLGSDDIYFSDAVSASSVKGGDGNDDICFGDKVTASVVQGGIGEDGLYFFGTDIKNTLIEGNEANDYIDIGDDSYYTTLISSSVNGGTGDDEILVGFGEYGYIKSSIIDGGTGDDFIYAGGIIAGDTVSSIFGGDGNDTITGDDNQEEIGAYFSGGNGSDSVVGTDYNDIIDGGNNNDIIEGGRGGDQLTGGTGNDLFVYSSSSGANNQDSYVTGNSAELGNNLDTITNFNATENDRFDLAYTPARVLNLTAGFNTDWQTTVDAAIAASGQGPWTTTDAGVLVVTGQNAGTYLLYDNECTGGWEAQYDGIVAIGSLSGTITTATFV